MLKTYLRFGRYVVSTLANVGVLAGCCCSS